ncbi:uncharacterized protein isoform X1 [Leptinotarsa decemlineata]|uniref:uncharacterized protein isoform X1 n=1 Tax=Leptinotarsa decemlineata TaxID=7539 RepID=UPI003D30A8F5
MVATVTRETENQTRSVVIEIVKSCLEENMFNCITTRSISCSPRLRSRLIKFRYGSSRDQQTASSTAQPKGEVPKSGIKHEEAIWDFQIAPRYRRKPLDEEEIAVINNGGPL